MWGLGRLQLSACGRSEPGSDGVPGHRDSRRDSRWGPVPVILLAIALAPPAEAETRVSGEISTSTTWTLAGSPYVVDGPVYVRGSGAPVLTIEPGVVVKAGWGHLISAGEGAAGSLRAIGTAEKPIVFTTSGAVAPDQWRGLWLMAGSGGSRLENVVVEGGGWGHTSGINVTGSAPVLKNVTVRTSSERGIRVEAGGAPEITDSTVTGTTFGVGAGIEISAGARAKLLRVAIRQCATHGLLVGTVGEAELTDVEISGNGGGAIAVQPGAAAGGADGRDADGERPERSEAPGRKRGHGGNVEELRVPVLRRRRTGLRARVGRAGADDRARGRGEDGVRPPDLGGRGRSRKPAGDRDGGEADRLHDVGSGGAGSVARSVSDGGIGREPAGERGRGGRRLGPHLRDQCDGERAGAEERDGADEQRARDPGGGGRSAGDHGQHGDGDDGRGGCGNRDQRRGEGEAAEGGDPAVLRRTGSWWGQWAKRS